MPIYPNSNSVRPPTHIPDPPPEQGAAGQVGGGQEYKPSDTRSFKIEQKILDMMKYGKPAVANFPRRERILADEIRRSMLELLRLAIVVKKKYYKKTTLQELDTELEVLQRLLQVAQDPGYYGQKYSPPLSAKKYEYWSGLLAEIGRMIGGYMKSVK